MHIAWYQIESQSSVYHLSCMSRRQCMLLISLCFHVQARHLAFMPRACWCRLPMYALLYDRGAQPTQAACLALP